MIDIIERMANKNIGSLSLFLKNKKNIEYLNLIESSIPYGINTLSEKVYYFVNNINELLLCKCGKNRKFIGFKNGYRPTCGNRKCYVEARKVTCIEKYGVDNPKKSKEIIEKEKSKILEKWGGEHYMKNESIRKRFKETMKSNHGVEWAQQSKEISSKSKDTFNNNPNKSDIIKNRAILLSNKTPEEKKETSNKKNETIITNWGSLDNFHKHINDKIKESSITKYGVEHHLSSPEIIEKRICSYQNTITYKIERNLPSNIIYISRDNNPNNTDNVIKLMCLDCYNKFDINRQYLSNRSKVNENICLVCNPILSGKSKKELEILDFIKSNYNGVVKNNDTSIISKELDIYLPELNLAFEFNGLYWHSELYKDKNFHLNKTKECSMKNIQLIHIWEDDWDYKQDIVKSIILNKLNLSKKIFARKCIIKTPNNKEVREFLINNHIQGFVGSKVKIGLYFDNELVSLVTFGNLRKSMGQVSKEGSYELLRFCNKLNYSVIGGASKLFKHFLNNNYVIEVISYSDNSRGTGNLYKQLKFEHLSDSVVNYYWVKSGIREYRFNYRKDKLVKEGFDINKTEVQIMNERGYFRLFDCGSKKWIYKNYI